MPYPAGLRDLFHRPAPGTPQAVALDLFQRIATAAEFRQLLECGGVVIEGSYADYAVLQNGGSAVINKRGEVQATCCLILCYGDCPMLDTFITNYLLLKSPVGERLYWDTACINAYNEEVLQTRRRVLAIADQERALANAEERAKERQPQPLAELPRWPGPLRPIRRFIGY